MDVQSARGYIVEEGRCGIVVRRKVEREKTEEHLLPFDPWG